MECFAKLHVLPADAISEPPAKKLKQVPESSLSQLLAMPKLGQKVNKDEDEELR